MPIQSATDSQSGRLSPGGLLAAAVAAGLGAGFGEVGLALARRFVSHKLWLFGPELVWLTPAADAAILGGFGAAYLVLSLVVRPLRAPSAVATVFVALAAFAVLSGVDALHWGASAVLSVGVGTVAGRAASSAERMSAVATRTIGVALALMAAAAGSLSIAERVRETREDAAAAAPGQHPNILLLVLDTVRAWNLGLYGYARQTTPRIDRRFAGGVVFDRALATAPWTLPSHASMFTGRLPSDLSANWDRPLDDVPPTIAEVLRSAGYATGGFVGNFRYAGSSSGLGRGFDRYVDYPVDLAEALRMTALARRVLRNPKLQEWLSLHRILEAKYAEVVNRDFLTWVDRHPKRPFFGFLNYVDAHAPYLPPAPYDSVWSKPGADPRQVGRRYVAGVERTFGAGPVPGELIEEYIDGYDGAISYLDVQVDSLLNALERRGRLANTIVILTADHGEHFGEHGLVQHGNSLYLPLLHVPLAVWAPGRVPAGLRIGSPASLRNVAATIADLAGVPPGGLAGRSLASLWRADSLDHAPDTLAAAVDWHGTLTKFPPSPLLDGSLRAVLSDSLHYIVRADGMEELYHLGHDFLEARNLAGIPTYRGALLDARAKLTQAVGPARGPKP